MSTGPALRGKAAEEAWRGIEKDPKLRTSVHPYSNVGGTPIREMESPIIKGAPKAEPRKLDVEKDLTNAERIFTGGAHPGPAGCFTAARACRSSIRSGVLAVRDMPASCRARSGSGASPVWAGIKAPMGEIFNIASDVERRGKVPWQVYMTGGKQYLDSSLQMVDTAVQPPGPRACPRGGTSTCSTCFARTEHGRRSRSVVSQDWLEERESSQGVDR